MDFNFVLYISISYIIFSPTIFAKEEAADVSTLQLVHVVSFRFYLFFITENANFNSFFILLRLKIDNIYELEKEWKRKHF